MKKLFSLLLVLALGMGLAACGSSDSSGSAAGSVASGGRRFLRRRLRQGKENLPHLRLQHGCGF